MDFLFFVFVVPLCTSVCVCLVVTCCPLGSRLWCLAVSLSLSHWYPGSGVNLIVSIPDLCTLTYCLLFHYAVY